jgi:cytochrome P450
MANDERYFSEPKNFKPERFLIVSNDHKGAARLRELNTPGTDPNQFAFGFGRRF